MYQYHLELALQLALINSLASPPNRAAQKQDVHGETPTLTSPKGIPAEQPLHLISEDNRGLQAPVLGHLPKPLVSFGGGRGGI